MSLKAGQAVVSGKIGAVKGAGPGVNQDPQHLSEASGRLDMSLTAHTHTTPTDAWARALCRNFDPEIWFPAPSEHRTRHEAKRVCRGCPLRLACLEVGMSAEYGIWGGLDEDQRRSLRRRNARRAA